MHPGPLEAGAQNVLAARFQDTGGSTQALPSELGVVHAMAIVSKVAGGLFDLVLALGMGSQRSEEGVDLPGL